MQRAEIVSHLRSLGEERLRAGSYPEAVHTFHLFECDRCEGNHFRVRLERHPGDEPGDFRGLLHLECSRCRAGKVGLGVTSGTPAPEEVRTEHPSCPCGSDEFALGLSERYEDWGFFDEGTVVALCASCHLAQALVDTD